MNHRVRLSRLAKLDLIELIAWYETEGGEGLADRFQMAVDATLSDLEAGPQIGRIWPSRRSETIGLRKYTVAKPFGKTLLFYQTTDQGLYIVRILRGERDLETALSQEVPPEDE